VLASAGKKCNTRDIPQDSGRREGKMNNARLTPRGELVLSLTASVLIILTGWLVMRGMAFMFVTVGDELSQGYNITRTALVEIKDLFIN
jgi:hypothetical protein